MANNIKPVDQILLNQTIMDKSRPTSHFTPAEYAGLLICHTMEVKWQLMLSLTLQGYSMWPVNEIWPCFVGWTAGSVELHVQAAGWTESSYCPTSLSPCHLSPPQPEDEIDILTINCIFILAVISVQSLETLLIKYA